MTDCLPCMSLSVILHKHWLQLSCPDGGLQCCHTGCDKRPFWRYGGHAKTAWMQAALCKASVWLNGSHVQSSALSILLKGRIIDCIDQWSISVCMSLLLLWLHPQPVLGNLINAVTAQWRFFVYLFILPLRWSVIDLLHIRRHLSLVKLAKAFV